MDGSKGGGLADEDEGVVERVVGIDGSKISWMGTGW